jgi:hypothetical protein
LKHPTSGVPKECIQWTGVLKFLIEPEMGSGLWLYAGILSILIHGISSYSAKAA